MGQRDSKTDFKSAAHRRRALENIRLAEAERRRRLVEFERETAGMSDDELAAYIDRRTVSGRQHLARRATREKWKGERRLTFTALELLSLLRRLADASGQVEISNHEIQCRLHRSEQACHEARRRLEEKNLIEVRRERTGPRNNAVNVFTLHPAALAGFDRLPRERRPIEARVQRPSAPAAPATPNTGAESGVRHLAPLSYQRDISKNQNTSIPTSTQKTVVAAPQREHVAGIVPRYPPFGSPERPGPKVVARIVGDRAPTWDEARELLAEALLVLQPDGAPDGERNVFRRIDGLRRRHLAAFSDRSWRWRLEFHGPRAYIAVAEALLRDTDDDGERIRSKVAYLGGILWRGEIECRPEFSVRSLLDNHHHHHQEGRVEIGDGPARGLQS